MRHGVLRLSDNEMTRPKWKYLLKFLHPVTGVLVKDYPINQEGGCTAEEMEPYCTLARANWAEFKALATPTVKPAPTIDDTDSDEAEGDEDDENEDGGELQYVCDSMIE